MLGVVYLIEYSPDPRPEIRVAGVDAEEGRDLAVVNRAAFPSNLLQPLEKRRRNINALSQKPPP